MTTMKDGPGDDPFADDTPESESGTEPETDETEPNGEAEEEPTEQPESESEPESESPDTTMSTNQIPYVVRRQTVKEDRTNELVTFARDEFDGLEDDIHADVAGAMNMSQKDVALTDIREGFIELASRHPEELADILLDWGYEHRQ